MSKRTPLVSAAAIAMALALIVLGLVSPVAAQQTEAGFPAHIHTGTCDKLDPAPKYPLENVHHGALAKLHEDADAVGDEIKKLGGDVKTLAGKPFEEIKKFDEDITRNHPNVIPVLISETVVDVSLSDLTATPHAINIHESADNIQTYIACGNITGTPSGKELSVPLSPLSDSGYSGIAWLHDEGSKTHVMVFLTQGLPSAGATPVATPAA